MDGEQRKVTELENEERRWRFLKKGKMKNK